MSTPNPLIDPNTASDASAGDPTAQADPDAQQAGPPAGDEQAAPQQGAGEDPSAGGADPADDTQQPAPGDPTGSGLRPRLIPGSDAQSGDMPAGPQENADVQQAVDKSLRMIHGRTSRNAVLKVLHDPSATIAEVVGRACFNIVMAVSDQKKAATGEPLPENILQEAAGYVVPELMTVGCTAGIFPFQAPADNAPTQPGQGNTEFDRQCRLAMLEATKVYGETVLKSPDGGRRSGEAQDDWARGVQQDVSSGKADPKFMSAMQKMRGQAFPPSGTGDETNATEDAPPPAAAADQSSGAQPDPQAQA